MPEIFAVRLYLSHSARAKPTRFWHHLSAPALSHRILTAAHRAGIEQAILHSVHSGYLPGKNMSHHHLEASAKHHPLCIELIDTEERLCNFIEVHRDELQNVRTILFRCELLLSK